MVIIILAGGSSSRLGKPKQLLYYQSETLIKRAVQTALTAKLGKVIVVSGYLDEELQLELKDFAVHIVNNAQWKQGIGSSIKTGIETLMIADDDSEQDAVLIMLSDQPLITFQHLQQLALQFYQHKNSMITASSYDGITGVPAVFDCSLFSELANLTGNRGAQFLFQHYQSKLTTVPFSGAAVDVDTLEDYQKLISLKT